MLSSQGPNLRNMCPRGLKVGYSCIFGTPHTPTPPPPPPTHTHTPHTHTPPHPPPHSPTPTPPSPPQPPTPTPTGQKTITPTWQASSGSIPTSNVSQWINITSRHRKHNNRTGGTTQVVMLVAWKTSGRMQEIWNFQAELLPCSRAEYPREQRKLMKAPGKGGVVVALDDHWLQSQSPWKIYSQFSGRRTTAYDLLSSEYNQIHYFSLP